MKLIALATLHGNGCRIRKGDKFTLDELRIDQKEAEVLIARGLAMAFIEQDLPPAIEDNSTDDGHVTGKLVGVVEFSGKQVNFDEMTKAKLIAIAADSGIELNSKMTKADMIEKLEAFQYEAIGILGSDTLPSIVVIKGEQVPLGNIVECAFGRSGLTESEWNALPQADRDAKLAAYITEAQNAED